MKLIIFLFLGELGTFSQNLILHARLFCTRGYAKIHLQRLHVKKWLYQKFNWWSHVVVPPLHKDFFGKSQKSQFFCEIPTWACDFQYFSLLRLVVASLDIECREYLASYTKAMLNMVGKAKWWQVNSTISTSSLCPWGWPCLTYKVLWCFTSKTARKQGMC